MSSTQILQKTFGTIDKNTLILILDKLGVGNPLLSWFQLYLSDRLQFVSLFNKRSENIKVTSGVPPYHLY
ncbi:Reverse transcriptase domain-containing protein [Aphis craccivora]|uniref:Reverse transcriptase domain-containing protein n=1 Tax=Aphis craccivora TaxID=307492 RepID=A0A6G0YA95_APHCR|nr:Reverse transcriptase domain-containing protein [Aphis craccivora]